MRNYRDPENPESTTAPQRDPTERMYDLSRNTGGRTPEEEAELADLIRKHGRPKFMASNKAKIQS